MVHHVPPWTASQHHVQKFYDSAWTMVKPRLYHDFDQKHGKAWTHFAGGCPRWTFQAGGIKSKGPSKLPWGTPHEILLTSELQLYPKITGDLITLLDYLICIRTSERKVNDNMPLQSVNLVIECNEYLITGI